MAFTNSFISLVLSPSSSATQFKYSINSKMKKKESVHSYTQSLKISVSF